MSDDTPRLVDRPIDVMAILTAQQDAIDRLAQFQTDALAEIAELRRRLTAVEKHAGPGRS